MSEGTTRPTDPAGVVRAYWERVWIDGDLDALGDLVADPSTRHTPDGTQTLTVAELAARLSDALAAVRGSTVRFDAQTVDGDTVWVRLTLQGCSLAAATPLVITWIAQYRVVGGRIVEMWALHQGGLDWSRG